MRSFLLLFEKIFINLWFVEDCMYKLKDYNDIS